MNKDCHESEVEFWFGLGLFVRDDGLLFDVRMFIAAGIELDFVVMLLTKVSITYVSPVKRLKAVEISPCKNTTLMMFRPKPTHPITMTSLGSSTTAGRVVNI